MSAVQTALDDRRMLPGFNNNPLEASGSQRVSELDEIPPMDKNQRHNPKQSQTGHDRGEFLGAPIENGHHQQQTTARHGGSERLNHCLYRSLDAKAPSCCKWLISGKHARFID